MRFWGSRFVDNFLLGSGFVSRSLVIYFCLDFFRKWILMKSQRSCLQKRNLLENVHDSENDYGFGIGW